VSILERIDEMRKSRDRSINQLAKQAGCKYSTVNNLYERNNVHTIPTLEKICSAFGISLAEFFGECTEIALTEEQKSLISQWDKLSSEQKKNVLPILIRMI
jgi:transcriptional regulator with XRE-family HTH domain